MISVLFQKRAVKAENSATKLKQENAFLQVGRGALKARGMWQSLYSVRRGVNTGGSFHPCFHHWLLVGSVKEAGLRACCCGCAVCDFSSVSCRRLLFRAGRSLSRWSAYGICSLLVMPNKL